MSKRRISDEDAQRIWRRAAELQAAAAERAELRRRAALLPGETTADAESFALDDVEAAAVEAGIGGEFVQAALVEIEGEAALQPAPGSWVSRAASRVLGRPPRLLEMSRVVDATPAAVLDAMQRIFPNHPFNLVLRDTVGSNAFTDGVYVFETNIATPTANFGWQVEFADIKRIFVTIRQLPGRDDACEVTVRAPLGRLGLNLILGGGFSTLGGGAGAAAGAAVAPGLVSLLGVAGILGAVVMGATAMVTGIASGGLVLGGYRALYRWGMRQGESALESLLQSLTVDVRTRGAFAPRSLRGETT